MQPISVTVGNVAANDQLVAASQNVVAAGSLTLAAGAASIAYPAQLVITTSANYSSYTFTITGTGPTGAPQTEVIAGPNTTTGNSTLYWLSVTNVAASGGVAGGAVKVGTTGLTSTRWVRFDSWTTGYTSIQCEASGTVNYTVQSTLDDPNDPFSPVDLTSCVWVNSNDSAVVNASTTQQSNFVFTPVYARIIKNSGTGTVRNVFLQTGVTNL